MKIQKKWVKKLVYFVYCPKCNKCLEGIFKSQLEYNYNRHLEACKSKLKKEDKK